jgi:predicted dehydrogenase
VIADDELVIFHGLGGPSAPAAAPPRLGRAHVAQFEDFVDAIQSDRPVRVGTRDGRAALAVVLSLYESAASGRPVAVVGRKRL